MILAVSFGAQNAGGVLGWRGTQLLSVDAAGGTKIWGGIMVNERLLVLEVLWVRVFCWFGRMQALVLSWGVS